VTVGAAGVFASTAGGSSVFNDLTATGGALGGVGGDSANGGGGPGGSPAGNPGAGGSYDPFAPDPRGVGGDGGSGGGSNQFAGYGNGGRGADDINPSNGGTPGTGGIVYIQW
jgi:hypothetical protein